jgi:hypothetical protein
MMKDTTPQELALAEPAKSRDSQNSLKPTTFHRFSDLPLELQDLIWGFVEVEPRIIIEKYKGGGLCFAAPYGPPAILHVSSKARAEGLRRFRRVISSGAGKDERHYHVDFSRDILFFQLYKEQKMEGLEWRSGLNWTISKNEKIELIRTVALDIWTFDRYIDIHCEGFLVDRILNILAPYLDANGALEEILIVPERVLPVRLAKRSGCMGEMGFASLEQEPQWVSDYKSYVSQDPPQISNLYIEKTKAHFEKLRTAEKILREEWNVRMKSMGKKIGIRVVHQFFVTERNKRNKLFGGSIPLRLRYYVSR